MTVPFPQAFAVLFSDLRRWSVKSFFTIPWKWPSGVIVPLSKALERRFVPIQKSETVNPRMVTLHFDGEIEPRDLRGKSSLKGRLLLAEAGDVIYSKIDVRNGAIGVVPSSMPRVAVTSEFPVYRVRQDIALPEFIKLLFRTRAFQQQINNMISGASGRKRVEPDALAEIPVPLPPVETQRAILAEWKKARKMIATLEERAQEIRAEIESQSFSELGLRVPTHEAVPKVLAVQWTQCLRWSVSYNQTALTGMDITRGLFSPVPLDSILQLVQYGTSEKANTHGHGVPVLRINNIKDQSLILSDLKHVVLPERTLQGLLLQNGEILIIRTSGSRDLVGTCGVFHEWPVCLCLLPHPDATRPKESQPRFRVLVHQLRVGAAASERHKQADHAKQYQQRGTTQHPDPTTTS